MRLRRRVLERDRSERAVVEHRELRAVAVDERPGRRSVEIVVESVVLAEVVTARVETTCCFSVGPTPMIASRPGLRSSLTTFVLVSTWLFSTTTCCVYCTLVRMPGSRPIPVSPRYRGEAGATGLEPATSGVTGHLRSHDD